MRLDFFRQINVTKKRYKIIAVGIKYPMLDQIRDVNY